MSTGSAIIAAAGFFWLGMVGAISFVEAPLKFRAPGVTLQIGLGIGRMVFRALNSIEVVLAVLIVVAAVLDPPPDPVLIGVAVAVLALATQLLAIRPRLTRRSNAVLADPTGAVAASRSTAHYWYLAGELVKIAGLLTAGIAVLAG